MVGLTLRVTASRPASTATVMSMKMPSCILSRLTWATHFVPADLGDSAPESMMEDERHQISKLQRRLKRRGITEVFVDLEPHVQRGAVRWSQRLRWHGSGLTWFLQGLGRYGHQLPSPVSGISTTSCSSGTVAHNPLRRPKESRFSHACRRAEKTSSEKIIVFPGPSVDRFRYFD